ncbi:TRAP transporter large permease [Alkalilimnicola ehrlichii MLHE-1]|uniref:TRAP transporter large permease protein n=1 Tax=Alkalilimnicola ehrlichii (strain ATCC BAA-1101 / DSM 17681 / MLHE-1) TaxID=187272 RepID=Q0A7A2_ALKEH|nr:TRAP transporter large permease [Alkalilimnicola ehrlichii]ABI57285.1 TRAP dicarboxylate transporter, DctM subunit [Alkalilimnicola ehrlichii MLHE-1]
MIWIMVGIMVGLLLLGFPLMVPLLSAALYVMLFELDFISTNRIVAQMVSGISSPVLAAVPLFILAADIMTKGRTANRLLDLVMSFFGHLRGGLPVTAAISCTLFGAVSGSTQATVVAIGGPLRPKLIKAGYKDSFTTALIINASDIALLIPPSIGMIVYGVVSRTSVRELFIAGILPGLLILLFFCVYTYIYSRLKQIPVQDRSTWSIRLQALRGALLPMGFPIIVVGGIYAGFFSPTEAAAVSVAYAFLLEVVIFRSLHIKEIWPIALSTGLITAVVFVLVASGQVFSYVVSAARIPRELIGPLIETLAGNPEMALIVIALAYFIGCMFVDPIVVILVLTPIFTPLVDATGLDPVHVGVIVTLQAAIGSATPPFGCDIFTAIAIFRRPYWDTIKGTPPFIFILLLSTAVLIAFPQISLFLPQLAFG